MSSTPTPPPAKEKLHTEIVLDLETMGNTPGCVVMAIGAAAFRGNVINPHGFYAKIDAETCIAAGLRMDFSTVSWWMQQSDAARAEMFGTRGRVPLAVALIALNAWIQEVTPGESFNVWGNDPTADNTWLSCAYRAADVPVPWKHYQNRCYRTLRALFKGVIPQVDGLAGETAHKALDDAMWEARHLINILEFINTTNATERARQEAEHAASLPPSTPETALPDVPPAVAS